MSLPPIDLSTFGTIAEPTAQVSTTVVPSAIEGEADRTISWQTYLWPDSRPATASDIQAVETKLNVTFPDDYKAVVMEHQGQACLPNIFKFFSPEQEAYDFTQFNVLFHFVSDDAEHAQYHIAAMHESAKDKLPEGVVPFGDDPGGGFLAFDFRVVGKVEGATGPCVVFFDDDSQQDEEGKVQPIFIASSFTGLLGQLRTEDEMEAEMDAAELVGDGEELEGDDEGDEDDEDDDDENADGEEALLEEVVTQDDDDDDGEGDGEEDGEHGHVAKRRKNEEGDDVPTEAGHEEEEDNEDDEGSAVVGEKRKADD